MDSRCSRAWRLATCAPMQPLRVRSCPCSSWATNDVPSCSMRLCSIPTTATCEIDLMAALAPQRTRLDAAVIIDHAGDLLDEAAGLWRGLGLATRRALADRLRASTVGLSGPDAVRSVADAWRGFAIQYPGLDRAAVMLRSALHGFVSFELGDGTAGDVDQAFEQLVAMLCTGFGSSSASDRGAGRS